jgi:hypothetical protein
MKKYKFVILETGHERSGYKSFAACKAAGLRCLRALIKKGLIFGKPEIEFYSVENGITYFIPVDVKI